MSGLWYLFIGYGVVWVGLFAYLLYVTGRVRGIRDDLIELRRELNERPSDSGTSQRG